MCVNCCSCGSVLKDCYDFTGQTSTGSEFYLGFFEDHYSFGCNTELYPPVIWITTTEQQPITVTVETYNKVIFSGVVCPSFYTYVSIPLDLTVHESAISYKGVRVRAEDNKKIVVFGQYEQFGSNDAYLALPVISSPPNGIFKYIVVSVRGSALSSGRHSVALIIGTEDDTKVTVIPTIAILTIPHGLDPFRNFYKGLPDDLNTVTINRYQTLYLKVLPDDLSGTQVKADKPISIFSGHECAEVPIDLGSCDMLIEQVPPTDTWGTEVVIVPLLTRLYGNLIKVIAADDSTSVTVTRTNYITGAVTTDPQFILNSGEFKEFLMSDYALIQSTDPILVYQFSSANGYNLTSQVAPLMIMAPSRQQFISKYNIATAPFNPDLKRKYGNFTEYAHYINIAIPAEYFNHRSPYVKIDDEEISSVFKPIRFSDNQIWGYATQTRLNAGPHIVESYHGTVMSVTIYGFGNQMSYGFTGGMSLRQFDTGM